MINFQKVQMLSPPAFGGTCNSKILYSYTYFKYTLMKYTLMHCIRTSKYTEACSEPEMDNNFAVFVNADPESTTCTLWRTASVHSTTYVIAWYRISASAR